VADCFADIWRVSEFCLELSAVDAVWVAIKSKGEHGALQALGVLRRIWFLHRKA
jgi:hypothetical protein